MKSEKIKTIKKRYSHEWLLIAVDKIDDSTTTPVSGTVVAHSPRRDEIYKKLTQPLEVKKLLLEYSEDTFPEGFAAAF